MVPQEIFARNVLNGVVWQANQWDEWEGMHTKAMKEAHVDVNTSVVEKGDKRKGWQTAFSLRSKRWNLLSEAIWSQKKVCQGEIKQFRLPSMPNLAEPL